MTTPRAASRRRLLAAALLSLGAAQGCEPSPGEDGDERSQAERIVTLYTQDPPEFARALADLPTASERDLVRFGVVMRQESCDPALCAQMETPGSVRKCDMMCSREHLQQAYAHGTEPSPGTTSEIRTMLLDWGLVDQAAQVALAGDDATATARCAGLASPIHREECGFRVAEVLADAGALRSALDHCNRAGRFLDECLWHVAWRSSTTPEQRRYRPGISGLLSDDDPQRVNEAVAAELALADAALAHDRQDRLGTLDVLRTRLWLDLYLGSGVADPTPARLAEGAMAPHARGGFALEAVRLLWPPGIEPTAEAPTRVLEAYTGSRPVPRGRAWTTRVQLDQLKGVQETYLPLPNIPVYHGGGVRLVGEDAEEDMLIAALEALYRRGTTPVGVYTPWLADPRTRLRCTAASLVRLTATPNAELEVFLRPLVDDPQACVRWQAKLGLGLLDPDAGWLEGGHLQPRPGGAFQRPH